MESILKYGGVGIIGLLCVFLFRLIHAEQKKDEPRTPIVVMLCIFMLFGIVAMSFAIATDVIKRPRIAEILFRGRRFEKLEEGGWKTYCHPAGFCIELPEFIVEDRWTRPGIQYYGNTIDEQIHVAVDCSVSKMVRTPGNLKAYYDQKLTESGVEYRFSSRNYFVVSGKKPDGTICYYKGLLKGTSYYLLAIEYPARYASLMRSPLTRISLSFR